MNKKYPGLSNQEVIKSREKYGTNEMNRKYHRKSQALCSHKLRFDFTTDAGALAYLNGKTFTAPRVEFMSLFD